MRNDVAAVIVAYRPVPMQLNRLVAALIEQCGLIFVMDNGAGKEALEERWVGAKAVRCIDMSGNAGLGAALNRGFELAREAGVTYVITFDQDSTPDPGMVSSLAEALRALNVDGTPVAAVGPRFVDRRFQKATEYPFMRLDRGWPRAVLCEGDAGFVATDFLITSGCLFSLPAYEAVGAFDAEMFVDHTDIEWGFRAHARGYRLYGVCSVIMTHELGMGQSAQVLGLTIMSYSPVRRYYYARNIIRLIRLPYVAAGWKLRMFLGLLGRLMLVPLLPRSGPGRLQEWRMLARGIWDGVRGVGGPIMQGSK